ncbi:MAG TPA: DUF1345 domain-containing protein [Rhodanobacteraceae bacterium]|nr:DUF1345 domain-containing protein [Rhodanobacteraceae bacterium]
MAERKSKRNWLARQWHTARRRPRYTLCALFFIALAAGFNVGGMPPARAVLLAFDIATLVFLAATIAMFARAKTQSMRERARTQDEGYWGFLLSSAAVAVIALVALGVELHASKGGGVIEIALAACSLLLSWLFLNTIFALHYAHEYYGDFGQKKAGLEFPGTDKPDYWDFLYFAFVIGMTFQVSDVQISQRDIRHVATAHALIAFFFNVIILALSVNVVAGRA